MAQYIDKSALVAEIERRIADNKKDIERASHKNLEDYFEGYEDALVLFKEKFLDTLEVKDANEALRTEYEKGRADVIADTLSWLENCWPKYCYNHTIIDAYKEGVVKD